MSFACVLAIWISLVIAAKFVISKATTRFEKPDHDSALIDALGRIRRDLGLVGLLSVLIICVVIEEALKLAPIAVAVHLGAPNQVVFALLVASAAAFAYAHRRNNRSWQSLIFGAFVGGLFSNATFALFSAAPRGTLATGFLAAVTLHAIWNLFVLVAESRYRAVFANSQRHRPGN